MRLEEDIKLDYSDVLFRPKRSTLQSRKDVNLKRTYKFKYSKNEWSGIPIMAANMDGVGELNIAENLAEFEMITCLTKQHDIKKIKKFKNIKKIFPHISLSAGIKKEDFENLNEVLKEFSFIKFICIDVANGYSEHFSKFVKSVRDKYPTKTIIAGNVVTADMTQELILSGADIVKVGIGPGSVCTTRIQTGVGYPQLSAVIECADAAHGLGAHIIADGGCTCPGDVAKGFGGGADFVMLGSLLAGTDETPGQVINTKNGREKIYRGMASKEAQRSWRNRVSSIEGVSHTVPLKGPVADVLGELRTGITSGISYSGATCVKSLQSRATFVRQTQSGQVESSTHIKRI